MPPVATYTDESSLHWSKVEASVEMRRNKTAPTGSKSTKSHALNMVSYSLLGANYG
jgi:hypothetical protein